MKANKHDALNLKRRGKLTRLLSTVLLLMVTCGLFAQQYVINGTIKDSEGNALPGVNIVIQGTNEGTITDIDGNFNLNSSTETATIEISYVGYNTEVIEATAGSQVEINLKEDLTELDQIIVIGYGTQKKSLVTGAISSIDNEDIESTPVQRAEQALQGKTAGVFVLPTSGSPGADMKVRIRGTGSNGASNPLYIVDGIKYDDINFLDPNDIESVEVLKDAASAAIYGAEGGNGVVIISTKKGLKGEGVVSYNFQYGVQSAPKLPELMNREEYFNYHEEAGTVGLDRNSEYSQSDTKWLEEIFEDAPIQKHHLSFSGGSDRLTYNSSFSYLNQDGIIGGDKASYERITSRINTTYQLKDWLKLGTNLSYSFTKRGSIQEDDEFGGVIASALYIDPATPTHYNANALPPHMLNSDTGEPIANLRTDSDGRYFALSENTDGEIVNPLLTLSLATGSEKSDNVLGSFFVELSPIEGLTITSRAGIDYYHKRRHYWNPRYRYSNERNNSSLAALDETSEHRKWQWENFATYSKSFDVHSISVTAGMSAEKLQHYVLDVRSSEMVFDDVRYAEHFATSGSGQIDRGRTYDEALVSYFGRFMYNYDERYLLQATVRQDGASSSMVPKANKNGVFPSFSVGWNVHKESFWTVDFVNQLKLRGSWGQNGNLANLRSMWKIYDNNSPYVKIRPFPYLDALTAENITYTDATGGTVSGLEPLVLPNPELTWETSEQTNIGIDTRFWDNRFNFSFDYYKKTTKDLLVTYALPAPAGNEPPFINTGTVENSGFEFDLGFRNSVGDFKYSINANLATLKNEVTEFKAIVDRVNGRRIGTNGIDAVAMEKGYPLWYFRGWKTTGLDADGLPVFEDISGPDGTPDGQIDGNDKTQIGNPHPKLIYGANFKAEYKGIDLGVFLQGVSGNDIYAGWMRADRAYGNYLKEFYTDRGGDQPSPAVINSGLSGQYFQSDYLIFDGSYMRIKQIQLGYTFPKSILDIAKIQSARIYVSLDDYFTFTKYPGLDPEVGSDDDASLGVDRGMYPVAKKMMFGLSVSF